MATLEVRLFGKFSMRSSIGPVPEIEAGKAQELLSYLLLHRDRPHSREALSEMLWGDSCANQAKKYLRQALWQLHTALDSLLESVNQRVVLVEPDWVHVNSDVDVWLDVNVLEQASRFTRGVRGPQIDPAAMSVVRTAVDLYHGDLLEDSYQDWCLYERERLQNIYLTMLDKLMAYCEAHGEYEDGIEFGNRILRHDRARERAHRGIMRLQYLDGDRTAALRQYGRCAAALQEELGVEPARSTRALYEQIRADQIGIESPVTPSSGPVSTPSSSVVDVLGCINQLQEVLSDMQRQMRRLQQAVSPGDHLTHGSTPIAPHPPAGR